MGPGVLPELVQVAAALEAEHKGYKACSHARGEGVGSGCEGCSGGAKLGEATAALEAEGTGCKQPAAVATAGGTERGKAGLAISARLRGGGVAARLWLRGTAAVAVQHRAQPHSSPPTCHVQKVRDDGVAPQHHAECRRRFAGGQLDLFGRGRMRGLRAGEPWRVSGPAAGGAAAAAAVVSPSLMNPPFILALRLTDRPQHQQQLQQL